MPVSSVAHVLQYAHALFLVFVLRARMLVSCVVHVLQYARADFLFLESSDMLPVYIYVGFCVGACSPFAGGRGENTKCRNEGIEGRGGSMYMKTFGRVTFAHIALIASY